MIDFRKVFVNAISEIDNNIMAIFVFINIFTKLLVDLLFKSTITVTTING